MTVQKQFVMVEHRRRAQGGAARPLRRFSVDEYHWLIEHGFFGSEDRVELIDGLLALPPAAAYSTRHPGTEDTLLLVEVTDATKVADTMLPSDRTTKLRLYAAAGIPEYWIINLVDRIVEVHRQPGPAGRQAGYQERITLDADGSLAPVVFPECRIDFSQVFP